MITFSSGGDTVTLKNPDYNDTDTVDTQVKYHISMSKIVSSYKKPKKEKLSLTFLMTTAQLDAFISFYVAHVGDFITYTDQNNDTWNGNIVNDPLSTTVIIGKGTCELTQMDIDFAVGS